MSEKNYQYVSRRGMAIGVLAAFIGNFVFMLVNAILFVIWNHDFTVLIDTGALLALLLLFIGGIVLSLLPALYGGRWMARRLHWEKCLGTLSRQGAMRKGWLLGALMGIGICVFAITFFYPRGDFTLLRIRIALVILIAGWMGSWAGAKLARDVEQLPEEKK